MSVECPRTCQAPEHSSKCLCQRCNRKSDTCRTATDDHFTPQCIEKIASIKDTSQNHQWLSRPCHDIKDHDTPLRKQVIQHEEELFSGLTGSEAFAIHRVIFEAGVIPVGMLPNHAVVRHARHQRRRHRVAWRKHR